jgi:hypothetical protein
MIWTIIKGAFSWLVTAIFSPKQPDIAKAERDVGEALGRSEQKSETDEKVLENVAKAQAAANSIDADNARGMPITENDGYRRD